MKILKLTMKKFDKTKDVIIDNSENQTNQLRNSVENELHLGKVEELGQFGTNTNILISIDHNLTKNMTKKTINQAIAQTLIGINKANTDVKSANIGIKINGTRVASSRWNEDAINNIEKYKMKSMIIQRNMLKVLIILINNNYG